MVILEIPEIKSSHKRILWKQMKDHFIFQGPKGNCYLKVRDLW